MSAIWSRGRIASDVFVRTDFPFFALVDFLSPPAARCRCFAASASIGPVTVKGSFLGGSLRAGTTLGAVKVLGDGWTAVTADSRRSAQFEHTVLVTETGVDVLTRL